MRRQLTSTLLSPALAGLLLLPAATPSFAGTPVAVPPPAEKKPVSAGLLNDALRLQNPAFNAWDIGGQFRFRYEVKDDAGVSASQDFISRGVDNDNDYFLFREKLHIGWQADSWFKIYVEGRGAQAESDDREPSPEQDVWDLHQAYVQIGDPKLFPLTLKAGRQEMTYGDQRFIGVGDWSNTGRSFDAVLLRYSISSTSWIDVFSGRVVIPRDDYFNESNEYDQFSGIYASTQALWTGVETQAFFLARNVEAKSPNAIAPGIGGPGERDVYTYGIRLKSLPDKFGPWDFLFEGAGQFGDIVTSGVERDLQSFALTGTVGYTFKDTWAKPRLALGYDYASGDSNGTDSKYETFDPLFGTNHSFYGVMDLVGLRNLNSPRVSVSLKPTKKLSLAVDYLLFWLADDKDSFYPESGSARSGNGYGKNPQYSSFVGSELDIVAKYAVNPNTEIHLGYGHFFVGDYIKSSVDSVPANGGASDADWVYLQAVFNF
ncbi:MAG TPA: alginate export family protein [Verrucomicrobium sp.]|nr:alginate export family protein [Verrucomicrobium sp.]